jgi:NADH dehydrogenase FAD-containing subunit
VVGSGGTGVTIAKFLHLWGAGGLAVTFIEPDRNDGSARAVDRGVVTGDGSDKLVARYGIRVLSGHIDSVDPTNGILTLADGTKLPFDRLVVAPGVELRHLPDPSVLDL